MNLQDVLKRFLLVLCACCPLAGSAQTMLTGNIKDGARPLPGATVRVENENKRVIGGSSSNMNGDYRFQMPEESGTLTIICSFIGYKTQQVKYTGQKVLNFVLQEDARMMEEVSVFGRAADVGSTGVEKRDMGIASQKIDLGDLQTIQATSVEDMLQGQLANVDIIASSGNPGSKMAIRIRGVNSLSANNEPLIVVDGIPYDTDIDSEFDFASATEEDFGALVNIAPGDIATIEVLKDAQATAIWGSKGANGVLVITTKVGTVGSTRFSITQKIDYKRERKPIPMLNGKEYITLIQDELWNYLRDVGYHWSYVQYLTQYPEINFDPQFKYYKEYNQNTNWLDIITQPALTSETNFSMQGGGDRARYRFSLGYLAEGGTTIGTDFNRLSARLNVDYLFSTRLRVSSKFYFAQGERDESWKEGGSSYSLNPRSEARERMPNMSPYVIDAAGKPTNEYFIPTAESGYTPFQGSFPDSYNPLALVNDSKNNTISRDVRVQFSIVYDLLPGLKYTGDIGFDIGSTATKKYLPYSVTGLNSNNAYYNRGNEKKSDKVSIYIDNRLVYNWSITEMHKVILAGLLQTSQASSAGVETAVSGLGSSQASDPTSGGKLQSFSSDASKSRSVGFIGNVHYNYGSRYLVNATVRHEGNSKMGRNRRWGSFATGALTWRFSEEPFLKEIEWLDESQVRGSWGFAGNSPSSSFPYIGTYSSSGSYVNNSSITPSTIQLNNLKWEKVIQKNAGLDLSLFQRKVNITFDLYDKITRDVLHQNVTLPSTTGFSSIAWMNSGEIENYGWEFRLDLNRIVRTKNFWGSFNFNISRNRNKVLKLPVNKRYERYSFGNGNYAQNVVIGDPLGSFYGYKYEGVYQNTGQTVATDASGNKIYDLRGEEVRTVLGSLVAQPGDARYTDVNHDGMIDKSDIVYLGNSMPVVIGGGGISLGLYGWQCRALFQYRLGQKAINTARLNAESMRGRTNQSTATLKRWRHEGDQTDIPRALWNRGYNTLGSDRFVDDASFLRLKQLMVSYTLPRDLSNHFRFSKFEVYMSAYDLWTLTNYKGQDPEVGLVSKDGSIYQLAEDNSYTPRSPRLTLGLSVEF